MLKNINFFSKKRKTFLVIISLLIITPIIVLAFGVQNSRYRLNKNTSSTLPLYPISSDHFTYQTSGFCFNNNSNNDYFIPNKTLGEWVPFYNRVIGSTLTGVSLKTDCCIDGICNGPNENYTTCPNDCGNPPGSNYTLYYASGLNGVVMIGQSGGSSVSQTVSAGSSGTPVVAIPDQGYAFSQWSDGKIDNPRIDTNVNANIAVTASYYPDPCPWGLCSSQCFENCPPYDPGATTWTTGGTIDPCSLGQCGAQCCYNCQDGYCQ